MQKKWNGTTYGNSWMHKWLVRLLLHTDLRVMYVFVAIFVLPICMIVSSGRKYIYLYFRKRWRMSPIKSVWMTYMNFYMFMQVVIDKFAMYAGKKFKVEVDGKELYHELVNADSGFMQLCSHIGNSEIAGYSLNPEPKGMYVLVFAGEKSDVMENRRKEFAQMGINMIGIGEGMDYIFEISDALQKGDIVSMPADRIFGSSKNVTATLLGKEVHLPMGPFAIASAHNLNIVEMSVMKTKYNTYHIYVTPIKYDRKAERNIKIRQMADNYIEEMERLLKIYPTQWYNYFDFWNEAN